MFTWDYNRIVTVMAVYNKYWFYPATLQPYDYQEV